MAGTMIPSAAFTHEDMDVIREMTMREIQNRLPQLMDIFQRIKDDVSIELGYDVDSAHPGIDKTIMRVLRQKIDEEIAPEMLPTEFRMAAN